MIAMTLKEIRELLRDRLTLFLLFFVPALLLTIFGYAANFTIEHTNIAVAGPRATALAEDLRRISPAETEFEIQRIDDNLRHDQIESQLRSGDFHAVLYANGRTDGLLSERAHMWINGAALFEAGAAQKTWIETLATQVHDRSVEIRGRLDDLQSQAADAQAHVADTQQRLADLRSTIATLTPPPGAPPSPDALARFPEILAQLPADTDLPTLPDIDSLHADDFLSAELTPEATTTVLFNPDLKTSWVMLPGLAGLILQFTGVVIMSIGMVREREAGTLEQLAVMPLSSGAIIAGKIIPYLAISLLNFGVVSGLGAVMFDVPFRGSLWLYALLGGVFLFVVLGMGLLVSVFSENIGQATQLSLLATMPQVLLSGLIFPLESMAAPIRAIGHTLPLTWFIQASQGIVLRGANLNEIAQPMLILLAMAVAIFSVASLRMRALINNGGA